MQRLVAAPLHQLLQLRLVVPAALLHIRLPLLIQQDPVNERTGRLQPAVQIHGGKNGLRGVRQNGRPLPASAGLLALAPLQIGSQVETLGHLVQTLLADQCGPDAGQVPLRQIRVLAEQIVRRHQTQHGVPQKLQPLIAMNAQAAVLIGVGAVI